MLNVRPEVQWFAEQMEERLTANEWKGGWRGLSLLYLLALLMEEMGEVAQAVLQESKEAPEEVIYECADVANLAMMITDKIRHEL